ncbi:ArsB/NhaD family transporter [Bacillus sp. B190/17]|uniref:ArsB/NhaD family transporter n=1 Tax=Bacillus lumedeiriae TaxID=3058829 RepID=A0ABW8IC17_9BACI
MLDSHFLFMCITFFVVMIMLRRPLGIIEIISSSMGAAIVLLLGIVPLSDLIHVFDVVRGATLTILSTTIMALVLDSIGFFKWIAFNIIIRSKRSGKLLFIYILLLCFLMTMFFNDESSILITTPIIIYIMKLLKMKQRQAFPYFISGALIAITASSPIAVSSISNLISLKIIGFSLNSYIEMMFVPSLLGIVLIAFLLYIYFKKDIPNRTPFLHLKWHYTSHAIILDHPLKRESADEKIDWPLFKSCIWIVILTRIGFFTLSPFGVPLEWIGLSGALLLLLIRWHRTKMGMLDVFKKIPWHILLFAFNVYVLVYGLKNVGLTHLIAWHLEAFVTDHSFHISMVIGLFFTLLSNTVNSLPAVMIGSLSITEMGMDQQTIQFTYLTSMIGMNIGALLTPIGALSTLLWMFLLKKHSVNITWGQYMKVTFVIIPIGLFTSLFFLYIWNTFLF